MFVNENIGISNIPVIKSDIDDLKDLSYKPPYPLPAKNFAMYIVGSPGSGKSSLMMSLLLSHPTKRKKKENRFYYKVFDVIHLISPSSSTLPKRFINKISDDRLHNKYSDDLMNEIIEEMKDSEENNNNLIVLDDSIRDLNKSKILSKIYLNRRHCTHSSNKEKKGGLSTITTSQKFSLLELANRVAQSDIIIFKSSNNNEINRIKDELMCDLSKEEQNEVLNLSWSKPYDFLYIKMNESKNKKYFVKFNPIIFEEE